MRPLRRLLVRTLFAPFLLLPLLQCSYPKPSAKTVPGSLARASTFTGPKMVAVPRRGEVKTPASMGGGPLDDLFIESSDPGPRGLWTAVKKTAGWRVTLERRKLVNVREIIDPSSPLAEIHSPGHLLADSGFHWIKKGDWQVTMFDCRRCTTQS